MRRATISAAVLIGAALLGQDAWAQQRTSGTSNGAFGSRTLGAAQQGAGSSFSGRTARSGVGLGQTTGQSGAGADAGSLSGNERFVRGNRQEGSFVGADTGDTENFVGLATEASGQGGQGGLAGLRGGGQNGLAALFGAQNNQNDPNARGRNATSGQGTIRTARRVAFSIPRRATAQVSVNLATRLRSLPGTESASPIAVAVEGRTVVLRGRVATDHDRVLAERVARLEPGVSRVVNELEVAPPGTEIEELLPQLP